MIATLSTSEKLILVEELRDDLAKQPSDILVPEWQKQELERRYADI